jgi:hypothetical protein
VPGSNPGGSTKIFKMNIIEQNIDVLSELESNNSNIYDFGKACRSFLKQDVYVNRNFPNDYGLALEVKRIIKETKNIFCS